MKKVIGGILIGMNSVTAVNLIKAGDPVFVLSILGLIAGVAIAVINWRS